MKLKDYLNLEEISYNDFAETINVSSRTVYRYVNGEVIPLPDAIESIYYATKGSVSPNDFFSFNNI
tara:strand:- start:328 stop:525 length:198 start_codon:yes stop_codon:yes gene_type:complete